jgi:hypothetical protein
MNNKAMQRKLKQRKAIDLSQCERTILGYFWLLRRRLDLAKMGAGSLR